MTADSSIVEHFAANIWREAKTLHGDPRGVRGAYHRWQRWLAIETSTLKFDDRGVARLATLTDQARRDVARAPSKDRVDPVLKLLCLEAAFSTYYNDGGPGAAIDRKLLSSAIAGLGSLTAI